MYGVVGKAEPERIKPAIDRAEDLYIALGRHRDAVQIISGDHSPLAKTLFDAQNFIREIVDGGMLNAKARR